MSKAQRDKGARFERDVVTSLCEAGLDAERNLSQSRDGGYDVDSLAGTFECKVRARLPAYLLPAENVNAVVWKQDRGEVVATIRWAELVNLYRYRHLWLKEHTVETDSRTTITITKKNKVEPEV